MSSQPQAEKLRGDASITPLGKHVTEASASFKDLHVLAWLLCSCCLWLFDLRRWCYTLAITSSFAIGALQVYSRNGYILVYSDIANAFQVSAISLRILELY